MEFSSNEEAQKAIRALNKTKLYKSKITLKFSKYHDQIYENSEIFVENSKNQVYWLAPMSLRKSFLQDQ